MLIQSHYVELFLFKFSKTLHLSQCFIYSNFFAGFTKTYKLVILYYYYNFEVFVGEVSFEPGKCKSSYIKTFQIT